MASASSFLSEEQFQCSICLDVFDKPVSLPCGHNFCKACITQHWDSRDLCQCPLCNKVFEKRPELFINTLISEMAAQVRKPADGVNTPVCDRWDQEAATSVEVPCDYCIGTELKAFKTCLVCLASYCESHLEPHQRVSTLKGHKLIDPMENLEGRVCKKHNKMLELFCRKDHQCICVSCLDHKTHDTVPFQEAYDERKAQLKKKHTETQQMIQERLQKVEEIKHSVKLNKKCTEKEMSDSMEVFTALVASIQRSQTELLEVIAEQQKASEQQAEGFIRELEQEITELRRRNTELENLLHTEDHLRLLHRLPALSGSPPTKDWSDTSIRGHLNAKAVRTAVTQLEETLSKEMEKLSAVRLRRIQQHAVEVTLDPDTANPWLILSADGKEVRDGDTQQNLPDNPERFDTCVYVLAKEGFASGRFYYEVQVKGEDWDIGVVRESVNRKGDFVMTPKDGYWTLWLRGGKEYWTSATPHSPLSLREPSEKVGVFVDYEGGLVSFYDVEARSLIYSFTGCSFTERLYPFFSPCVSDDGGIYPLTITPVKHA